MKKLLILLALISLAIVGCNKLDSNKLEPKDLEGYWKLNVDELVDVVIEFKDDNKFIMHGDDSFKEELNYSVNTSDENSMNITVEGSEKPYNIEMSDDEASITMGPEGSYQYLERISKEEFEEIMEENSKPFYYEEDE